MHILLTGPMGQIGWELQRTLTPLGQVTAVEHAQMDLTCADSIRSTIQALKPNLIINAAAYTAVDLAESEPESAHVINAIAPGILAEQAREIGAALVHFSTDYVFDGNSDQPYLPDDATNPLGVYGMTKLLGEQAIQAVGIPHLILRTSWVFSRRRSNFLLTMMKLAATQPEIRVVNDQHGCPTWSRSIALATADIIAASLTHEDDQWHFAGHEGIYHVANKGSTTWYDFARHIFQIAQPDPMPELIPITTEDYPTAAVRPRNSILDCRQTKAEFGVELVSWQMAVEEALGDPTSQ